MPRPRNSTEMRPSMPARKRWPCLNSALFSHASRSGVFLPPRCGMHTTLTPSSRARGHVLLTEEAAIRAIQFRSPAKGLLVALEGGRHVDLVRRVSLQHLILRDQALRALGEEHLVAELDGGSHLAAFDQIGMGLEDRIDLLGVGNLLSVQHAAARLIDHTAPQTTIVLDLLADFFDGHVGKHVLAARLAGLLEHHSCAFHDLLGNADELAICPRLLLVALPCRHALDFVHPTPRRTRAIAKTLDTSAVPALWRGGRPGA